jgi:hypothetical protein
MYYYPSVSSRAATILVGQASTPAAGLQTRSRFMFAACRYVAHAFLRAVSDLRIVEYGFDGRLMDYQNPEKPLPHGDSYTLNQEWVYRKLSKFNDVANVPFRIFVETKDKTLYSGEVLLHFSQAGDRIKAWYGPTTIARKDWLAIRHGR